MKALFNNLRKRLVGLTKFKLIKYLYVGPVRKAYRLIRSHTLPNKTKVEGFTMYLDKYDTLNLDLNATYGTKFFKNLLKKNIKKGYVCLNIGANIGYYSLFMGELVGKKGKVYSFEPSPENFKILKKNVKVNNLSQVECVNQAVSDKSGKIKLYLAEYNQGDHRIFDSGNNRKSVEVNMTSLKDFFPKNKKIDFILMDTQGAEYSIFKGMKPILEKNQSIKIITEFSPVHLIEFGFEPIDYLKEIKKNRFKIYNINEEDEKLDEIKDFDSFLKKLDNNFTDLYLSR